MELHYLPLSNLEIKKVLLTDAKCMKIFRGVFAADTLPTKFVTPAAFIVNTDIAQGPGEHWNVIFIDNKGNGEFFDSYGLPPLIENHVAFLKKHCNKFTFNKHPLQSVSSSVCGHYCCLYVAAKSRNINLNRFLSFFFPNDCNSNDALVILTFMKKFGNIKSPQKENVLAMKCCSKGTCRI